MKQAYGTHRANEIRASGTHVGGVPEPSKGFTRLRSSRLPALRLRVLQNGGKPAFKAFHADLRWL
jgi:hypothetical protein